MIKLEVVCEGAEHRIDILPDGEAALLHHDLEADLAAIALGFEPSACLDVYGRWDDSPIAVLMDYALAIWPEDFVEKRWGEILVAWIEPWVPVVMEELSALGDLNIERTEQKNKAFFQGAVETLRELSDELPFHGDWADHEMVRRLERYLGETRAIHGSLTVFANQVGTDAGPATKQTAYAMDEAMRYFAQLFEAHSPRRLVQDIQMTMVFCGMTAKRLALREVVDELRAARPGGELLKSDRLKAIDVTKEAGAQERLECLKVAIKMLEAPEIVALRVKRGER